MATTIHERFDSRESTEGAENASVDLVYVVEGSEDDDEVRLLLEGTYPSTYAGLLFQTYHISHQGGGVWEATVRYGKREPKSMGESSFSFDTGGVTAHITQSLATIHRYVASGTAPDFKGAIGVTSDSVEGTDITVPVYNFTETYYMDSGNVDGTYKATLFQLTGKVNNASFKGFAAGEVLFMGASGSQRGSEDWEITYRFAASPNITGLTIGALTGIAKKGWEYLWVRYADSEDQHVLVKQPVGAYVEQVYELADFSLLDIGV